MRDDEPKHGASLELRLAVEAAGGVTHDVALDVSGDTRVEELAMALARHCGMVDEGDEADVALYSARLGRWLSPNMTVAESDVRNGDDVRLEFGTNERRASELQRGDTELVVVGGPVAGLRCLLPAGRYIVGRDGECDVRLDDPSLSRRHLNVEVTSGGVLVSDAGSRNGSSVDAVPLGEGEVRPIVPGQHIEIGRTSLAFCSPSNASARALVVRDGLVQFNRQPRLANPDRSEPLIVESPPTDPQKGRLPLGAALLPLIMGVAFALIVHQWAMLLFAALSPLMIVWTFVSDHRSGRKSYKVRSAAFRKRVELLGQELEQLNSAETSARRAAAPDAGVVVARAKQHREELWERRPVDEDFLDLRLGSADQASRMVVKLESGGSDKLRAEAQEVIRRYALVPAVPAVVAIRRIGVLGVAGPADRVAGVGRWLAAQAAALHSPRDLVIVAAIAADHLSEWEWIKWLPHVNHDASPVDGPQLASGTLATRGLLRSVSSLISVRRAEADERFGTTQRGPLPHVLVILDEAAAVDRASVGEILAAAGPRLGVSAVWLGGDPRDLPGDCSFVAELEHGRAKLRLIDMREGEMIEDVAADAMPVEVATDLARGLAAVRDVGAGGGRADIPRTVSLLELLDLTEPDSVQIAARWDAGARHLGAPIGVAAGEPFAIDLRLDGPHGLVAGTTGSGKSELLQAMVAALAATHPPSRLSFLLIDYKGGAAFKDCAQLPHTVGMVTDLDAHLTQRALTSLNAELRRRETLLKAAGAKDLADMEARDPLTAPASLAIIIDEFAALAREVPAFVDGVVDVAQRGRSLGVHLVLATQRPGGVVSENIRANANLRIALRVASPVESEDVISSRDAARIPRSLPGRAYARTGHSELTAFQAAYVGGHSSIAGHASPDVVGVRDLRFDVAQDDEFSPRVVQPPRIEDPTDLQRLVAAICAATRAEGLADPPSPWLPKLDDIISWRELEDAAPPRYRSPDCAVLGLLDEPVRQRQSVLGLDLEADGHLLIYGTGASGKTTILRTIAVSLAHHGSPDDVQVYGLDFASRGLVGLEALPHCGSIVVGDDDERVARLLAVLRRTIEQRKRAFADVGAFSLTDYRRSPRAATTPRIVLLLDSYAGFTSAFERVDGGALVDAIPRLVADGRAVGVHVVITADRRNAVPPTVSNLIARKLVLRMADDDEYAALGLDMSAVRGAQLVPGRGFTDRSLEFQVGLAGADASSEEMSAELARLGRTLTRRHADLRAPAIRTLPTTIARDDLPSQDTPLSAYMGIRDEDLTPFVVDLSETHFLVAGPYRSGRSTALGVLAQGIRTSTEGAELHLLAPRRGTLAKLGLWTSIADGPEQCTASAAELVKVVAARAQSPDSTPVLVVVDDAAELAEVPAACSALEQLVRRGRDLNIRVVIGIEVQSARVAYAAWIKEVRKDGHGILLDPDIDMDGDVLGVRLPRRSNQLYAPGRGYYVEGGLAQLVQISC